MTGRQRSYLLLVVAIVAFAGMVVLVATGVSFRRRTRDLVFGLEEFDRVIGEGGLSEASAMLPWLAERAPDASGGLSVLRRGFQLAELHGEWELLDSIARTVVDSFPGNSSIRQIAVFAAYMNGDHEQALDWANRYLRESEYADLYALALLGANERPPEDAGESQLLDMATLDQSSSPEAFVSAWVLTGDRRYAIDAVLLHAAAGEMAAAEHVARSSSLPLYAPMLAYEILLDRGEYQEALTALRRIPASDRTIVTELREAAILMRLGRHGQARAIYEKSVELHPQGSRSAPAYVNLSWLANDRDEAEAILNSAVSNGVNTWAVTRQLALTVAAEEPARAHSILERTRNEVGAEFDRKVLELRLEPNPDRVGYAADLWGLVNAQPSDPDLRRLAYFYFYTRGLDDDLELLLERSDRGGGAADAWTYFYRGALGAREGNWIEAAENFDQSYSLRPSWYAAYNGAVASFRAGRLLRGSELLDHAGHHAAEAGYPAGTEVVLLAMARVTDDRNDALDLIERALEINPASATIRAARSRLLP